MHVTIYLFCYLHIYYMSVLFSAIIWNYFGSIGSVELQAHEWSSQVNSHKTTWIWKGQRHVTQCCVPYTILCHSVIYVNVQDDGALYFEVCDGWDIAVHTLLCLWRLIPVLHFGRKMSRAWIGLCVFLLSSHAFEIFLCSDSSCWMRG